MIQLLIAILMGLAYPTDSTLNQNNTEISSTNETTGVDDEDGTGDGTKGGGVGGNTGQLPPPPIVGG